MSVARVALAVAAGRARPLTLALVLSLASAMVPVAPLRQVTTMTTALRDQRGEQTEQ